MILQQLARLIGRFRRNDRGGVLIEAAFVLPIASFCCSQASKSRV